MGSTDRGGDWREAAASAGVDPRTLGNAAGLLLAGHRLALKGDRRSSAAAYRELLRIEPDHPGALRELLAQLRIMGRREEAAGIERRLIEREADARGLEPGARDEFAGFRLAAAGLAPCPARAPASYVAHLFDGCAGEFDELLRGSLGYRAPELVFAAVSAELGPAMGGLDVLDLGCGTGLSAPLIRPHARRLDGVDLSPGMLAVARERGLYDRLDLGDLVELPRDRPGEYDLVLAVDVLNYLGDLAPALGAAGVALRPGGTLALTVEAGEGPGYALGPAGRYVHSPDHVRERSGAAGFAVASASRVALRTESFRPVDGEVFVLRKGPDRGGLDGSKGPPA